LLFCALTATNSTTALKTLTGFLRQFNGEHRLIFLGLCYKWLMPRTLRLLFILLVRFACSRRNLLLENLALRQQLGVLKRKRPQPRFAARDKLFWVILQRLWPGWKRALILVQPETVVRWHQAGLKLYWTWLSRHRTRRRRKCVSRELRDLIFRIVAENPTWGAPRIHGELRMLGFDISE
jgi:hypothetical protein